MILTSCPVVIMYVDHTGSEDDDVDRTGSEDDDVDCTGSEDDDVDCAGSEDDNGAVKLTRPAEVNLQEIILVARDQACSCHHILYIYTDHEMLSLILTP